MILDLSTKNLKAGLRSPKNSKYHDFGFIYRELKTGLRSPRFTDQEHGLELFRRFCQQRDVVCVQQIFDEKISRQSYSPCGSSARASLSGCIMMMKSKGDSGSPWGTPLPMGTVLP